MKILRHWTHRVRYSYYQQFGSKKLDKIQMMCSVAISQTRPIDWSLLEPVGAYEINHEGLHNEVTSVSMFTLANSFAPVILSFVSSCLHSNTIGLGAFTIGCLSNMNSASYNYFTRRWDNWMLWKDYYTLLSFSSKWISLDSNFQKELWVCKHIQFKLQRLTIWKLKFPRCTWSTCIRGRSCNIIDPTIALSHEKVYITYKDLVWKKNLYGMRRIQQLGERLRTFF